MTDKLWKDKETLEEMYCGKGMSTEEIATELGCNSGTINYWMRKFDLERRSRGDAISKVRENEEIVADIEQHEFGKTCPTCGKELNSERGVRRHHSDIHNERLPNKKCKLCGKPFYFEKGKGESRYHCDNCKFGFKGNAPPVKFKSTNGRPQRKYNPAYEVLATGENEVKVHQLLALAKGYDPYKVFSNGEYHIHHKIPIPWLNIIENIELLTAEEHASKHPMDQNDWSGLDP